jgi:hypothetical protein
MVTSWKFAAGRSRSLPSSCAFARHLLSGFFASPFEGRGQGESSYQEGFGKPLTSILSPLRKGERRVNQQSCGENPQIVHLTKLGEQLMDD